MSYTKLFVDPQTRKTLKSVEGKYDDISGFLRTIQQETNPKLIKGQNVNVQGLLITIIVTFTKTKIAVCYRTQLKSTYEYSQFYSLYRSIYLNNNALNNTEDDPYGCISNIIYNCNNNTLLDIDGNDIFGGGNNRGEDNRGETREA